MHGPFGVRQQLAIGRIRLRLAIHGHQVPFVQHHLHRKTLLPQQIDDEGITTPRRLMALQQQQHLIHLADGGTRALHQTFPQQMVRLMNPRGIHQDQLRFRGGEDGAQTIARGLRDRGCDRHLVSHQLVHQGGFADIGAANQSDETGAVILRKRR